MSNVLVGRTLNAIKNADGTVTLEFIFANTERYPMILTAADATNLNAVLTGGTGVTSSAVHASESGHKNGEKN